MSMIIKGIDKPSDCDYCDLEDHGYCRALGSYIDVEEGIDTRCPIEEIVRCAECRYLAVQNTKYLYAICHRHGIEFKPFEDDTRTHGCSWGERKESE